MTKKDTTDQLLDDALGPQPYTFIALGQHYWEKRDDGVEALKAVKHRLAGGGLTPAKYQLALYKVDRDTVVTGTGGFSYPGEGMRPELVRVVEVTKANGRFKDLPLDAFK